jgi:SAM-dependent methyltransferase
MAILSAEKTDTLRLTGSLIKDIIEWDVVSWSKILKYWDKDINWGNVHTCLELGGRRGGLSLWLALKGKQTICSDISNTKENAEKLHLKYNINTMIYQNIDAINIPFKNYFDIIVFKSIIGGIGKNDNIKLQQKVFDEIYESLKRGGKLLFAENLVASPIHQFLRRKFVPWGRTWRYVSIEELGRFLFQFKSYKYETSGILAAFGRTEWQRNILARIDQLIFNRIFPEHWKYIIYGIAEK